MMAAPIKTAAQLAAAAVAELDPEELAYFWPELVLADPDTPPPSGCGSDTGFYRHKRAGEEPCDMCRMAHNARDLDRIRSRSAAWAMREWANMRGFDVAPTGRIPDWIVRAYRALHPGEVA